MHRSMKRILLLILFSGCGQLYLMAQSVELRGVWMTPRSGNNFWTKEQIARAMDSVANNNFNVVYFNAWSRGWPLWRSTIFLQETGYATDPAAGERDLLQEAITEAHRRGLEIEAWMEYGFVGWWSGYNLPGFPKGPLFQKHPDWLARSYSGSDQFPIDPGTFYWMSHNHPAARMFLLSLHQELAQKYDLDGIELDRIRYPNLDCGYDSVSTTIYKQENNGAAPPANPSDPQWMRWRADKLNSFHAQVYDSIKSANAFLIVSNAPSHYGSGDSYPAYQSFLQDWKAWLNAGKLDAAQVQMYADPVSLSAYIPSALNGLSPEARTRVFAGIAIKPGGNVFSVNQVIQLITTVRSGGLKGISIWYYNDLLEYNYFPALKSQVFPSKSALPHRKESWRNEGMIIDETSATRTSGWKNLPLNSAWKGSVAFVPDSVPNQSVQYQFAIPGSAYYGIYAFQSPLLLTQMTNRAPYSVRSAAGLQKVVVDQSSNTNLGWIKLADAFLDRGNSVVVEVSNEGIGMNKLITADAVMLLLNRKLSPTIITGVKTSDRVVSGRGAETLSIFPNPFNSSANFHYSLSARGRISLELYDTLGRRVATVLESDQSPGFHQVQFSAAALSSGMYIARLFTASSILSQKLLLLR